MPRASSTSRPPRQWRSAASDSVDVAPAPTHPTMSSQYQRRRVVSDANPLATEHARKASTATNTHPADDYDDLQWFYTPHSITALVLMLACFFYVALWVTDTELDSLANIKIGLAGVAMVFVFIGTLMFRDGPFIRPHPVIWRVVLACSALYQLVLVFIILQKVEDVRYWLRYVDPSLGIALPERNYATSCDLTWTNLRDQIDEFVVAHVLGWVCKAIMFRDYWILWILSIMFEVLEYSLEHQLPNFSECWWDHWILDVLLCNWIGLEIGMWFCRRLELKEYSWRHIRHIPTVAGKVRRAVQQFTPYSWTRFDWEATRNYKHFFAVIFLICVFLQGELNAFYLKYLLWIPPTNPINTYRLAFMFFTGTAAIRESYQYLTDPDSKRLGSQAWLVIANIMTETLICVKFGKDQFHEPFPLHIILFWSALLSCLVAYAVRQFVYLPYRYHQKQP